MAVALEELRIAIADDPNYAPAYNMLGLVYMELRENAAARGEFRARAAALAQRSRHQQQLRLVPVPDRARERVDQVLPAGGAQPALPDAGALLFRRGPVRAAQAATSRRPRTTSSARCRLRAGRSERAAATRPDPLPSRAASRTRASCLGALQPARRRRPPNRCGSRCASSASSASASPRRATRSSCAGASRTRASTELLQRGEYD